MLWASPALDHTIAVRHGLVDRQRPDLSRLVVDPDQVHAFDREVAALTQTQEFERPDDPFVLSDLVKRAAKRGALLSTWPRLLSLQFVLCEGGRIRESLPDVFFFEVRKLLHHLRVVSPFASKLTTSAGLPTCLD